jgi:hypothetical protein
MTWDEATYADVLRARDEHDRLGADTFLAEHGFSRTLGYSLMWEKRPYPPKAILGTPYEFAASQAPSLKVHHVM